MFCICRYITVCQIDRTFFVCTRFDMVFFIGNLLNFPMYHVIILSNQWERRFFPCLMLFWLR